MPLDYVLAPGLYEWRGEQLVRLDERFRRCAVLIGTAAPGKDDEISPWGTGFLIGGHSPKLTYLVTAAHVVAQALDAPFDIRFNVRGAGARNHREEHPNWHLHPTDNTVDVAVHAIEVPEWADVSHVPMVPNLALGDRLKKKDIGAGCETYTVGLWKFMHGKRRNQTFVHTGHIGLIPEDEKIPVDPWRREHGGRRVDVEAYLVESEPLDGSSGSPVFVRRTLSASPRNKITGEAKFEAHMEGSVWLLGLQSDVFRDKPGEDYEIAGRKDVLVPRGVNVVVPVAKIIEVLEHPSLTAGRGDAVEAAQAARTPMKAKLAPPTMDENPQHKEDFNRLLGAAVKSPKSGGRT